MRKLSATLGCLALGFVVLASGCGSDGLTGVNSGDELNSAEIQALFSTLGGAFMGLGLGAQPAEAGGGAATIPIDENFNQSVPCESGSISMSGSVKGQIDDQTYEADLNIGFTLGFNACAVSSDVTTVTVSNPPGIEFSGDFVMGQTSFSIGGHESGGFDFVTSDDRSGSCAIDVTFDASYDSESGVSTSTVSGSVCGVDASSFDPIGT